MKVLNYIFVLFLLIFVIGCKPESSVISERQELLRKFVDETTSQYIQSVVYNHDENFAENISYEYAKRTFNDERFWEVNIYKLNDSKLSFQDVAKLPSDIRESLKNVIKQDFEDILKTDLESSGIAITLQYPGDFGKGLKSVIYILPKAFEKDYIKYKDEKNEVPMELKIRAILKHEYAHAKNNFEGIKINNELTISNSNRFNFDQDVVHFADEMIAHIEDVEFTKQFGKDNLVYLYSLKLLLDDFLYYRQLFENKNLTSKEEEIIDVLSSKVDKIIQKDIEDFELV